MPKGRILIIEDDEDILELLKYNLQREGFDATGVRTGEEGLKTANACVPDLILLDIMLPGLDGNEVCRMLKSNPTTANIPIIMLTAKTEDTDIIVGLELGADDYVTKPFEPRVLMARLRAVLRRKYKAPIPVDETVKVDELLIIPAKHEVRIKDKTVNLTFTEFRILHFLASRRGWVFSRYQIVDAVRGEDYFVTDRAVDVQIAGLRKKLGPYAKYIETVRGVGYRFKE